MLVYLNCYKDHWVSPHTIVERIFFWTDWSKCGRNKCIVDDKNWVDSPEWADKLADKLTWVSNTIKFVWDLFDHKINFVKIQRWDTWSADHTLSYIILPMLKQLRDTKHGSPMVDDEDVPENIRSVKKPKPKRKKDDIRNRPDIHAVDWDGDDSTIHLKWDWVLGEMIWAFEQKVKDDDESQFFDHTGCGDACPWDKDYVRPKVDWDGLKAHQARKANGFRLFGLYFEGLWD